MYACYKQGAFAHPHSGLKRTPSPARKWSALLPKVSKILLSRGPCETNRFQCYSTSDSVIEYIKIICLNMKPHVANRHLPTASDVASGGLGCIVFRTAANRGVGKPFEMHPQVRDTSVFLGKARPP